MRRSKKITFQLLICFSLCIVATLSFAAKPKDVIVVNPESQPVPVTGGVEITGTPTVNIGNTSDTPVWVADVENPAQFALRMDGTVTVPQGFGGSFGNTVGPSLAADLRFVIEYVSFECVRSGAIEAVRVWLYTARKTGQGSYTFHSYPIPLSFKTTPDYAGTVVSIGTQSQRWYHDGGQALQVGITLSGAAPAGGISCNVDVSGYTVGMP